MANMGFYLLTELSTTEANFLLYNVTTIYSYDYNNILMAFQ